MPSGSAVLQHARATAAETQVPSWLKLLATCAVPFPTIVLALWVAGRLHGLYRNLIPQSFIGCAVVSVILGAYVVRFFPHQVPSAASRAGIITLSVGAMLLTVVYIHFAVPYMTLHYDLASWSESFFTTEIIKWKTGATLYLQPDYSNSAVYTPLAPALTYFLAKAFQHADSIVAYRVIQQVYLVLSSFFLALASWHLVRLVAPEKFPRLSRTWLLFLVPSCFLFVTNRTTNAFNIFLHVDALGVLATAVAFWMLSKRALTQDARWLWPMAAMPSIAFLVKQYLAVLAVVYVVYLWLEQEDATRRTLGFAGVAFGGLAATIAACLAIWGFPFRYWVLSVMGQQIVSVPQMFDRLDDAALFVLPGFLGSAVLLSGSSARKVLGITVGWLIMLLAASYTSGITYTPTHLGPATVVGGCLFLAALITAWPEARPELQSAQYWLRLVTCMGVAFIVLMGLGYHTKVSSSVPADFYRYVADIENEFRGLPPDRVLTDFGDWVYLRDNVLMKDRAAILPVHRDPRYFGMIARLQRHEYAKILVRHGDNGFFPYEIAVAGQTGIRKALLQNYREVKRIRGVAGMDDWLYHDMLLSDVEVFEPTLDKSPVSTVSAKE